MNAVLRAASLDSLYYWFSVGFLHLNLIDIKHGHKSLSFLIIRLSQTVDNVSRFCDPISKQFLYVFRNRYALCVGLRLYFYRCSLVLFLFAQFRSTFFFLFQSCVSLIFCVFDVFFSLYILLYCIDGLQTFPFISILSLSQFCPLHFFD